MDNYFTIKQNATHANITENSLSRAGMHKYSIMADIVGGNSNRQAESLLGVRELMTRCRIFYE